MPPPPIQGILPLFYTRRIGLDEGQEVPSIGGGKVTGRIGPYSVGVMNVTTDEADVRVGNTVRRTETANFTAVRVKRNMLSKSSIGGILLNREGGLDGLQPLFGVDAGFMFGPAVTLIGLVAKTTSPDEALAGKSGSDLAAVADVGYKNDRFNTALQYLDIGARFNPEMGFVTRIDVRLDEAKAAWTPRPRWTGVRQVFVEGNHRVLRESRRTARVAVAAVGRQRLSARTRRAFAPASRVSSTILPCRSPPRVRCCPSVATAGRPTAPASIRIAPSASLAA